MARGWRDTYFFLRLPPLEEKPKFFNLFSDCPLMTCSSCLANLRFFHLYGVAKIHFCLLDTAEMVYAPCSSGMAANFLLRKPNGRLGGPARLLLPWGPPESVLQELPCIHACFSVPKIGNQAGTWCSLCHQNR